jgi:hypothetical protein
VCFGVAVGDLNGDGLPDLVLANKLSDSVSVLRNTTTPGAMIPTFAAKQDFAAGSRPVAVVIGDLNGDGLPDLAVVNSYGNSVSTLVNQTARGATSFSFAPKHDFPVGTNPQHTAIRDLNGDGKLDLVVANDDARGAANTVSVLLNTTAPGSAALTFVPQQTFATGSEPFSVAVGDLNGDGQLDLAVANSGQGANSVSVLLHATLPPPLVTISTATATATMSETAQFSAASDRSTTTPVVLVLQSTCRLRHRSIPRSHSR